MEEKKESVNVSPDPSEQRAPLSPSADEAQAASAGSAPMDPAKCGAHEIHCIEQEAELAEARVRERVRTEAAEAERALDNAAHCASTEQKSVLAEEQPDKAQNTRLSSAKSPAPSDEQAVLFTAAEDQSSSYSGCAANAHYCRRSADDDSFSAAHHAALCG